MIAFTIKDIIDILLVAMLLFYVYRLMKDTRSLNVFLGILIFIVIWLFVSRIIEMRLLGAIMDNLISVGALALIVIFQEEIRDFLYNLGARNKLHFFHDWFKHTSQGSLMVQHDDLIMPIVMACMSMSKGKVGALIVIERETNLDKIAATGDRLDANIAQRLIENIFFKNSPLHDGAMIISNMRIRSAGCILPVSHSINIPKELGLRHRAALGVTQETDAIAVVVSEETGGISVALDGRFRLDINAEELEIFLAEHLGSK